MTQKSHAAVFTGNLQVTLGTTSLLSTCRRCPGCWILRNKHVNQPSILNYLNIKSDTIFPILTFLFRYRSIWKDWLFVLFEWILLHLIHTVRHYTILSYGPGTYLKACDKYTVFSLLMHVCRANGCLQPRTCILVSSPNPPDPASEHSLGHLEPNTYEQPHIHPYQSHAGHIPLHPTWER